MAQPKKTKKPKVKPLRPGTGIGENSEFLRKGGKTQSSGRELAKSWREVAREETSKAVKPKVPAQTSKLAEKATKAENIGQRIVNKLVKSHEAKTAKMMTKASKGGVIGKAIKGTVRAIGTGVKEVVSHGPRIAFNKGAGALAKKALGTAIGRVAAPAMLAYDVYTIGKAVKEGHKAYKAGKEAKELYEKMKTWKPGKRTAPPNMR